MERLEIKTNSLDVRAVSNDGMHQSTLAKYHTDDNIYVKSVQISNIVREFESKTLAGGGLQVSKAAS